MHHQQQRERSALLGALRMKGVGVLNMLIQKLAKSQSKHASHTRQESPFLPPYSCSLPCFQTHIQSVSHSLLAHSLPAHWLPSTEQQCMKHKAHHELKSRAGTGRYLQEVNKHWSTLPRWSFHTTLVLQRARDERVTGKTWICLFCFLFYIFSWSASFIVAHFCSRSHHENLSSFTSRWSVIFHLTDQCTHDLSDVNHLKPERRKPVWFCGRRWCRGLSLTAWDGWEFGLSYTSLCHSDSAFSLWQSSETFTVFQGSIL